MSDYPKFEKVNENTVRIISEKIDEVSVKTLVDNLKQLKEKRDKLNEIIANVEDILDNAEKLGLKLEQNDNKK